MHFNLQAEFLSKFFRVLFEHRRKGYARHHVYSLAEVHIPCLLQTIFEVVNPIGNKPHAVFNLVERAVIRTVGHFDVGFDIVFVAAPAEISAEFLVQSLDEFYRISCVLLVNRFEFCKLLSVSRHTNGHDRNRFNAFDGVQSSYAVF